MPWEAVSRRAKRLPANWKQIRKQVLERDGYQCRKILPAGIRCPEHATDVDHIQAMLDDHSLDALQSLCAHHHGRKSGSEGGHAAAAKRIPRKRPAEKHPGLLT